MAKTIHTVVIYPRLHPDPICALFLLRTFGQDKFPGINEAKLEFWNRVPAGKTADQLEEDGTLLLDMGSGKFDHHGSSGTRPTDCASTLVAKYLGISDRPELRKLLVYVKRDDLEGRGIVSKDVIDRAFGLSAIVMNLYRAYPDHREFVVDLVYRIFHAHYLEEYKRKVVLPQEWKDLQKQGKAARFNVSAGEEVLHVVIVESDSKSLIGFVRAVKEVQADVVVQRASSGHTNIVTRQRPPRLDLRKTVAGLRLIEARKKPVDISNLNYNDLTKVGQLDQVNEWYFDTAANTIQNGGAAPQGITPTRLSLDEIRTILIKTLPTSLPGGRAHQIPKVYVES